MTKKDKGSGKDTTKENQPVRSNKFVWEPGDLTLVEEAPKKPSDKIKKKSK